MLPSIDYKARLAARDTFSTLDMLKAQEDKTRPLLVNWNNPCGWDKHKGVIKDENGEPVASVDGFTLADSVTKEDLLTELHMRSSLNSLAINQLEHQAKVIIALQAEVRLQMRESFLFKSLPSDSNKVLVNALHHSRLSVPSLFGPVPDYFKHRLLNHQGEFPSLKPPAAFRISGPPPKKKFRGGPSGNRGSLSSWRQVSSQRGARGQARRSRGSKNYKRGGRAYSAQVYQPATQEPATRGRGRSRGGKAFRGARGKKKR